MINIAPVAVIRRYINLSMEHTMHLKFTNFSMSNLSNKKGTPTLRLTKTKMFLLFTPMYIYSVEIL